MNFIKETRKELGLTQTTLAEILGLSRVNLAMAETGSRPLSSDNVIKLCKLKMKSMREPELKMDDHYEQILLNQETFRSGLLKQIEKSEKSLQLAEQKLAKMENKYNGAIEALKVIEAERKIFEGVSQYIQKLDEELARQKKTWIDNHPASRIQLEWNIQLLRMEIEACRAKLDEMNIKPGSCSQNLLQL